MKFAEFHPGQVIEAGPVGISAEEIVAFARQYDPQWFPVDVERAHAGRHGGRIARGWQTCGLAMRLAVQVALEGSESFASPGLSSLRWLHPGRPGDELRLKITVLETRRSRSQGSLGILRWRWQMFNQRGTEVLDVEATSLFDLPAPGVPAP
ncbi:MAG: MaoC family dehydratase [Betaproteobacteria bacterium]